MMHFSSPAMRRSRVTAMRLAILLIAAQVIMLPAACAQQAASDTRLWGEVTDGLQLSVTTGTNTALLTETQSFLYLSMQMRNVSNAPVPVDFSQATYDFEYEIDGTWYAFERMDPVRTSLSIMRADLNSALQQTIAPGTLT